MQKIGEINIEIYKTVTDKKILTNEVILTDNRINHIIDRRGQDFFSKYSPYFSDIIKNPDFIFKDSRADTAIVAKTVFDNGSYINLVLRLAVEGDNPEHKNSIITAIKENNKRFSQRLRNNIPVYRFDNQE